MEIWFDSHLCRWYDRNLLEIVVRHVGIGDTRERKEFSSTLRNAAADLTKGDVGLQCVHLRLVTETYPRVNEDVNNLTVSQFISVDIFFPPIDQNSVYRQKKMEIFRVLEVL